MGSSSSRNARAAGSSSTRKPDCAWTMSDMYREPRNGIKVMTTFGCGGGSSMGYKRAGCDVVAANDIDEEMAWHYRTNLNPKHYFLCPIIDLLKADLPDEVMNLDILDGSPPCSTFSTSGNREKDWGKKRKFIEGGAEQVLSDLFFDFIAVAERLQPKVIVAENVKGMIIGNARGYVRMVCERLRAAGYRTQVFLVNAADCGVPQKRERVFFCAVRTDLGLPPLELKPTHRWITTQEAISDLADRPEAERFEDVGGAVLQRLWSIAKPGASFRDFSARLNGSRNHFNFFKLNKAKPAPTVTATPNLMHWDECRLITLAESIRLQSFPDDYTFKSAHKGKYLIGMSVPPKMMEVVARAVCSQWLGVKYGKA